MNNNLSSQFRLKLSLHIVRLLKNPSKELKGFTLLELLVVMIFVSLLAVVALPNLVRQAGKAREVEFKNVVGIVNRSQQAYHWEKQNFAQGIDDAESLKLLNVSFDNRYIDAYNIQAFSSHANIALTNLESIDDQTRIYSGAIYHDTGRYSMVVCQSLQVATNVSAPVSSSDCGVDAERVR